VEERTASLAVGADGRDSLVRRAAGFDVQRNPKRLRVSGVLLEGLVDAPSDTSTLAFDIDIGHQAVLFPLGGGRARTYVMTRHEEDIHLQGEKDVDRLRDLAIRAGLPAACLAGARAAGPLASFDGAASWVERPYQDGVALVGDAAGTSDPSWGQGLSLALRSARQLRDAVLAHEDRETAGEVYAAAQHGSFGRMLSVERIYERMLTERGQEADAKRAQALPLLAQDPTVMPDHLLVGPDLALEGPLAQIYAT
jgi:2-polyprenyl-6-methoxyphenol hydroxylase-like FAD-dependent oxidoreductase